MSRHLQDLYPPLVLDHGKRPRNRRVPAHFTHSAIGDNPLCGDQITVYLCIQDGIIQDIAFDGLSCALATASASLMTEALMGCDIAHAHKLRSAMRALVVNGGREADAALGVLATLAAVGDFKSREQCATLAWQALEAALADDVFSQREQS
jgi:nitrogen fixation NifU-like protein